MSALWYLFGFSISLFYNVLVILNLIFVRIFKTPKKNKDRPLPPKCLTNPDFKHSFVQLPGIRLHYVEKGDNSKPLMLFVHGFPEFWYSWRNQLEEFSKDYWVVAFDMRGYGDSEKPVGKENYVMKLLVGDIVNLVKELGREKFTIVAHDWGAAVAWNFISSHSHMLDKYVIINLPHPQVYVQFVRNSWKQFLKSWYVFFFQMPCIPELILRGNDLAVFNSLTKGCKDPSIVTEEDIEAFKFTFGKPGAFTPPINYYRSSLFTKPRKEPGKKLQVKVPGILIFGKNDLYLDFRMVESTKEYVENLETQIIEDANHFVQQTAPKDVNTIMRKFLAK